MSTYAEAYQNAVTSLTKCEVPEAALDAWYLLEYVTELSRADYFLSKELKMPEHQKLSYEKLVAERGKRIPLQYLTGEQEFMGYSFQVNSSTLIPRQDTEILVEEASKFAEGKSVLDLCTGTGCILISLAKLCHLQEAVGTDISKEAVALAKKNAEALEVSASFYCGDLFQALPEQKKFDLIVSNPPYICTEEIKTLQPEVREHEPMSALDGTADGLKFYREIIAQAPNYLKDDGLLLFEIGCEQAEAVSSLLALAGFTKIKVRKDYTGLDRVVYGMERNYV